MKLYIFKEDCSKMQFFYYLFLDIKSFSSKYLVLSLYRPDVTLGSIVEYNTILCIILNVFSIIVYSICLGFLSIGFYLSSSSPTQNHCRVKGLSACPWPPTCLLCWLGHSQSNGHHHASLVSC